MLLRVGARGDAAADAAKRVWGGYQHSKLEREQNFHLSVPGNLNDKYFD